MGGRSVAPARAALSPGSYPVATVIMHLTDEAPPIPPIDAAAIRPGIYGDATENQYSVKEYYRTQTYGQIDIEGARSVNGSSDVFGPYDIADPFPGAGCQFAQWSNRADERAALDGFDFNAYKAVIYLFDTSRCGFAGIAGNGPQVWINGYNPYTIAHELGHRFGNGHASTMRCYDGPGGPVATYTANCDPLVEYGDPFDPMGGGGTILPGTGSSIPHEMEPWRKIKIGAIPASDGPLANTPGTYRIAPIEQSSGVRMLRLPTGRGDGKFFDLSFRQPIGIFDSSWSHPDAGNPRAFDGVLVNLEPGVNDGSNSALLDMTPETPGGPIDPWTHMPTTGFEDAPLQVGRTFSDAHTGLSLTVNAVGASGADVSVAYGQGAVDVATPTAPGQPVASVSGGVVSLSWGASSDAFGVSNYVIERNGVGLPAVAGLSGSDSPGAGTFVYRVRAVDGAGNVSPASPPVSVTIAGAGPLPPPPPTPRLSLTKLFVAKGLAKITFTLNRAARVVLSFARKEPGRLKGRTCVAPSKSPKGRKCTRLVAVRKTKSVSGRAGANSVVFAGKIDSKTKLAPGAYVLTATAAPAKATVSFTVPKPKKKKK